MKKTHFILLFALCGILALISCSKTDRSVEVEQDIITELFPVIFKKTFQDYRKIPIPPPPPLNDSKEELKKMQKAFEESIENYKIFLDTTLFVPLYVIVNDSAYSIPKFELKRMYEEEKGDIKFLDTTTFKKSFKLDLSQIDLSKDYILKYRSDFSFPIDELIKIDWQKHPSEEIHLHQFSGMLGLSRIYFNKEQNYGFLHVSFSCGKLCGCGYRVFIKKNKGKWIIDKIDNLGCA